MYKSDDFKRVALEAQMSSDNEAILPLNSNQVLSVLL